MSHNRMLIGTITEKARASWTGDKREYRDGLSNNYQSHWIATAKAWRDKLQAEGLADTVEALNRTIAFFERISK